MPVRLTNFVAILSLILSMAPGFTPIAELMLFVARHTRLVMNFTDEVVYLFPIVSIALTLGLFLISARSREKTGQR